MDKHYLLYQPFAEPPLGPVGGIPAVTYGSGYLSGQNRKDTDTRYGLISLWFRRGTIGTTQYFHDSNNLRARLIFTSANNLEFLTTNNGGTPGIGDGFNNPVTISAAPITDSLWHHLILSYDSLGVESGLFKVYIDGVDQAAGVGAAGANSSTLDLNRGDFLGANTAGANNFQGDVAQFYQNYNLSAYYDLSIKANRDKFYDSDLHRPRDIGVDGTAVGLVQPDHLLATDAASYGVNAGTDGNWTVNGTFSDAATSPGPASPQPSPPIEVDIGWLMASTALTQFPPRRRPLPYYMGRAVQQAVSEAPQESIRIVLDSTHGDYASVIAALTILDTQDSAHSVDRKLITAEVPASRTGALAPISWPDQLGVGVFMDEYVDDEDFDLRGRALLGLDSREVRYVRKPLDSQGTGTLYGDGSGRTFGDGYRGPQDPSIGPSNHTAQLATTYYICDGAHVRPGSFINPLFPSGGGASGSIAIADASGLGAAQRVEIRGDYPGRPGMFWGTYTLWEGHQDAEGLPLPWEEYEPGVYVQGVFQDDLSASGRSLGGSIAYDADVEDVTVSATELIRRHILAGKSLLSDLSGVGGRGRFHAQHPFGGASENWDRVVFNDGANNWTDLTTPANDATTADWTLFPAGASDGAYVAFISTGLPFSTILLNLAQIAAGGATFQFLYSVGGLSFNSFTNLIDNTNGLTVTSPQQIAFNPKSDWVEDTFATGTAFETTGYAVIIRKASGVLSQAVIGDQAQRRRRAVFIHRWNDAAPTRGVCTNGVFNNGFRYITNSKGNVRYVNFRQATGAVLQQEINTTSDWITFEGCQLITFQSHQFTGGVAKVSFVAGTQRERWWSISDHLVQDGNDPIFTDPEAGLVAYHGDSPTFYNSRPRWADLCFVADGLYQNGGAPQYDIRGFVTRNTSIDVMGMNDVLFRLEDVTGTSNDNHFFAIRGSADFALSVIESIGFENVLSCEFYAPATGNNDQPVLGSGANQRNIKIKHGYIHTWNGVEDPQQPGRGIGYLGDPDRGAYSDGTGLMDGNEIDFFYVKGMNYSFDNTRGHGFTFAQHLATRTRHITVEDSNWLYAAQKDREQCLHTFVHDASAGTFTDVSAALVPSGAGGITMFPNPPEVGDMFIGALPASLAQFPHRMRWILGTPAVMGTAVLSFVYWRNDNSWQVVSNPSSTDLTVDATNRFDFPSDMGEIDINGVLYHAFGFRLESGAFTTIPVANEIRGRLVGSVVDLDHWVCKNPRIGVALVTAANLATNATTIKSTNGKIIFGPGQDSSTPLFAYGATSPNQTPAQWQANVKGVTQTDALEVSVFDPDLVLA